MLNFPKNFSVSGYTTTYNCLSACYPFEISIRSMLGFCDEIIVVDSGSTDGTLERLYALQKKEPRIKVFVEPVDFNHPRWAVHNDGYLKGKARAKCQAEYCWQMDVDEIVVPQDWPKVNILPTVMGQHQLIMLPMIEFWGSFDRIRADFFTLKLRFSKNDPRIIHGIPQHVRMYDENGHEYPRPFESDCCNYIYKDTLADVPPAISLPRGFENSDGVEDPNYPEMFNKLIDIFPSVLHLSWLDFPRKIKHYQTYWHKYQYSMYNLKIEDSAETNVMFDKTWAEVSDQDIQQKAQEFYQIGPRSFHGKINYSKIGRTLPFNRPIPQELIDWAKSLNKPITAPAQSLTTNTADVASLLI